MTGFDDYLGVRNRGSGGEGWSSRVADLVGRNAAVRGGWQEEEQRMSLVWETIIWRFLLDMGLCSGFISEVFHSQINLSFPTNGRRIHLRKGWQGLQEPLDRAKHLVRVARLLLYCCVFSFSASSGRGGLSSEESVLSWWSSRLTTGSARGMDVHADTLVHPSACDAQYISDCPHPSLPSGWESLVWGYAVGCGYFLHVVGGYPLISIYNLYNVLAENEA